MLEPKIRRLGRADLLAARQLLEMMADTFEEPRAALSDAYLSRLLADETLWILGAFAGPEAIGGMTAHILPMTRSECYEAFIYDLAVHPNHQRQGVGRRLVEALRREIGTNVAFVAADNEDSHALDFYRAMGGRSSPVTVFTFERRSFFVPDAETRVVRRVK